MYPKTLIQKLKVLLRVALMSAMQQSLRLIIMVKLLKLQGHDAHWLTVKELLHEVLAEVLLKSLLDINSVDYLQDLLIIFALPFIMAKLLIIFVLPFIVTKVLTIFILQFIVLVIVAVTIKALISLLIKQFAIIHIKASFLLTFLFPQLVLFISFHYWVLLTF